MYGYEPRDRSGPMDIDEQDPMARVAQFALPHPEEGPSRKRLHSDISAPSRPFNPSSGSRPLHFGTNTPFMFHLPSNMPQPPPSTPWKPYDPRDFQPRNLGFCSQGVSKGRAVSGLEDVEMAGDSPARVGEKQDDKQVDEGEGVRMEDGKDESNRPVARGAVAREVRRRKKKAPRDIVKQGRYGDEDQFGIPSKTEHQHHYNFHAPSLRHSDIPSLLLGYIQVFVNVAVVLFVLYLAVQFVLAVRRDVQERMQEVSIEILQEIAECTKLYLTNRCDPALRVPAMEAPCKAWEACMHRDPTIVGRTNVMAETFAGVINSFVDPISWKTMGFTLTALSFLVILTNSALWNLRSRVQEPIASGGMYPQHFIPSTQHQYVQDQRHQGGQGGEGGHVGGGHTMQDDVPKLDWKEGDKWKTW